MDGPGLGTMKPVRKLEADEHADEHALGGALDVIEQLLAKLGPDAATDDAALALWEPAQRLAEAAEKA
jgi:hypothetical protein